MKKILVLILAVFLMGCESYTERVADEDCLKIVIDYQESFDRYLLYKYDGSDAFYASSYTEPAEWIFVKEKCPALFKEYILPIKLVWDSIQMIPRERTLYEGVSADIIARKIKMKDLDKIKVKKSSNIEIKTE